MGPSFSDELAGLEEEGLLRGLRALPGTGGKLTLAGHEVLNFSSNDYLNLAGDPRLKKAAQAAIDEFGCGATASRLMAGHLVLHERLEQRLAALAGKESALVFPTGYQTNIGVVTALAGRDDVIFSDELNHASIVDAARLSRARICVYRHGDMDHLEALLSEGSGPRRNLIVTDTVFSMDGDLAPVEHLAALSRRYGALLVVDEAHAIGVVGKGGGLCREAGVDAHAVVGTLSKALGGEGGFVAGSAALCDLIVNKARSFIYSTGLAPACAGSAIEAVSVVESTPELGRDLLARAARFRELLNERGLSVPGDPSQIVPVRVGENRIALALSEALFHEGILVTAIRPPTVPKGTARLRFSITLAHTEADLEGVSQTLAETCMEAGAL